MSDKYLFAIFAHPDDEAFGPSGTLYKRAQSGEKVHVICVTDGAANGERVPAATRSTEFQESCRRIGATPHQLDFDDGKLCNDDYARLEETISSTILDTLDVEEATINFMTYEPKGITGHIDHITVSFVTTHLFCSWKKWMPAATIRGELWYFCLCDAQKAEDPDYFIYSPKGYPEERIDMTIDIEDVLTQKKEIIRCHASQADYKAALALGDHLLSREHFLKFDC